MDTYSSNSYQHFVGLNIWKEGEAKKLKMSMYRFTSLLTERPESSIRVTADSVGRGQWLRVLHDASKIVARPLQWFELKDSCLKTRKQVEWKCTPLLIIYFFDISERKEMSAIRHCIAVKRQCFMCIVTEHDIISEQMNSEKSLQEIRMDRSNLPGISKNDVASVYDKTEVTQGK